MSARFADQTSEQVIEHLETTLTLELLGTEEALELVSWLPAVVWASDPTHPSAIQPGSFREALIGCIRLADETNRRRLYESFGAACFLMDLIGVGFMEEVVAHVEKLEVRVRFSAAALRKVNK